MKKILFYSLAVIILCGLTACGNNGGYEKSSIQNNTNSQEDKIDKKTEEKTKEKTKEKIEVNDDEIIDFDDEDNESYIDEKVVVQKVINCDGCVYAYFSEEKSFGSILSEGEYTTDVNNLKTSGGKQRHNFFGIVLADNKISRAYSCILKDNIIYCTEGSVDGSYHTSNIGILNQIFTANQCRYISDGHTYVCTDGSYNGDTQTSGYTSLHYETSCTIYGADAKTGKMACN